MTPDDHGILRARGASLLRVAFWIRSASWGGAEIQAVRAAKALLDAGVDVHVWARDRSPVEWGARAAGLRVEVDPPGANRGRGLACVDVVHVHEPKDLPWAVLLSSRGGPVVVATRHLAAFPRRRRDPYHRWLANRVHWVAASGFVRDSLTVAYGIQPNRIAVVPYGYQRDTATPPPVADRELGVPDGSRVVGMLSRLSHGKHLGDALAILAQTRTQGIDSWLVVAGEETDAGARRELLREARSRGMERRVRLLGFRRDVPALLTRFGVLLHTAHAESFGLALLEAQAHGCPVVAYAGGGIPERVRHGESGWLVAPGDVSGAAAGIAAILGDAALASRLRAGGRALAEKLSPSAEAHRLLDVYRAALDGHAQGERSAAGSRS